MIQVDKQHYFTNEYLSRDRFIVLQEQLKICLESGGNSFLEIGPGPGFLTQLLRHLGKTVTTLDYDHALTPDIVASVLAIPSPADTFDAVVAFQVLEHLPFINLTTALSEMNRVSRKKVIFSVPDHEGLQLLSNEIKLTLFGRPLISYRGFLPIYKGISNPKEHYWELGCAGVTEEKVLRSVDSAELICLKSYLPWSYFHFFECSKK